jgi:hypothetical protein
MQVVSLSDDDEGMADMWLQEEQIASERQRELLRIAAERHFYATIAAGAARPATPLKNRTGLVAGRRALGQMLVRTGELVAGASLLELESV